MTRIIACALATLAPLFPLTYIAVIGSLHRRRW